MTEITPHAPAAHPVIGFLPRADEFRQVTDLATRLASTEFVPKDLRGNPASVLAAMLVGREIGIGPMHALRSIHVIEGRPTLSAELLMSLVLKAGHDLWVAESTRERCEVRYRRAGWPSDRPDGVVVWTAEDAEDANLTGKSNWTKYRRAMLRSRAVSEAARQGFPDVVEGVSYTAEEVGAEGDVAVESMSPDVEDLEVAATIEDEVEVRRGLYVRAGAAYRSLKATDETLAANAWTAANSGLGADGWQTADLEILEGRVADIERLAAESGGVVDAEIVEDDEPDDEPDDGQGAEPDDTPDAGDDGDAAEPEEVAEEVHPNPRVADAIEEVAERDAAEADALERHVNALEGATVAEVLEYLREHDEPEAHRIAWGLELERDRVRQTVRAAIPDEILGEFATDAPQEAAGDDETTSEGDDTGQEANGPETATEHVPSGLAPGEVTERRAMVAEYRRLYREVYTSGGTDAAQRMHALRLETIGANDGGALWVERADLDRLLDGARKIHAEETGDVPF